MGGGDVSYGNPMASYSLLPGEGDDYDNAFSPGWVPDLGRHQNGWIQFFAQCSYQPTPGGGRSVGMKMRHYSGCAGFPYGTNSMSLDATDDIPYRWVIVGTSQDFNVLFNFGVPTYFYRVESDCMHWYSGYPYTAWIEEVQVINNGC